MKPLNNLVMVLKKMIGLATIFFLLMFSCKETLEDETESKQVNNTQLPPKFEISFPGNTGFEIKKTEGTSQEYPNRSISESILEGRDKRGSFMYFITQEYIPLAIKSDIQKSNFPIKVTLKNILTGAVSNFNGKDLEFREFEYKNYKGMQVRGIIEGEGFKGVAKYRAMTDGENLFIIGSAGQNFTDADTDPFLDSFQLN